LLKEIDLSIIIVTWNSAVYIKDCIDSVNKSSSNLKIEIVVVDNNSTDNTVEIINNKFPEVTIIVNKNNVGFGAANNQALNKVVGKNVLFLNPDTVINHDTIKKMVSTLENNSKIGAIGPVQYKNEKHVIFTASDWNPIGIIQYIIEFLISIFKGKYIVIFPNLRKVPLLNLGCVLCRREILDKGVSFDNDVFLYGEELHFFPQIIELGYKIVLDRSISIFHFREKSISLTNKKFYFIMTGFVTSYIKRLTKYFVQK